MHGTGTSLLVEASMLKGKEVKNFPLLERRYPVTHLTNTKYPLPTYVQSTMLKWLLCQKISSLFFNLFFY